LISRHKEERALSIFVNRVQRIYENTGKRGDVTAELRKIHSEGFRNFCSSTNIIIRGLSSGI
jgi:hypothetical protein